MSNRQELCYGWDVFEKFIICIAWYLKTLRLNGASAWLRVSTVPIYHGMLHLCVVSPLKERKGRCWMSHASLLLWERKLTMCHLVADGRSPWRIGRGLFERSECKRTLGQKCISVWDAGARFRYAWRQIRYGNWPCLLWILFRIWWYLRVKWVFALRNPPNSWSFWFMAEWEVSRSSWCCVCPVGIMRYVVNDSIWLSLVVCHTWLKVKWRSQTLSPGQRSPLHTLASSCKCYSKRHWIKDHVSYAVTSVSIILRICG